MTSTGGGNGRNSHALKFAKVLDGRKQPIRGLWIRNHRYYAQLTVENPITGLKKVKRVPLVDKEAIPVTTVAQAIAEMGRLKVQRADKNLPTVRVICGVRAGRQRLRSRDGAGTNRLGDALDGNVPMTGALCYQFLDLPGLPWVAAVSAVLVTQTSLHSSLKASSLRVAANLAARLAEPS